MLVKLELRRAKKMCDSVLSSNRFYVYAYLDNRKPGKWEFENHVFDFSPYYIGCGCNDRIDAHLNPSQISLGHYKGAIIQTILNLDLDPLRVKIYENLTQQEAYEIEIKMINYFGRLDLKTGILTNLCDGGLGASNVLNKTRNKNVKGYKFKSNSKGIDKLTLDGEFIESFSCQTEAQDKTGIHYGRIDWAIKTSRILEGFLWKYNGVCPYVAKTPNHKHKKEIFQYTLEGVFVRSYESRIQAVLYLGKKACQSNNITGSIRNDGTAFGFKWLDEFMGDNVEFPSLFSNKIVQLTLEGEELRIWNSMTHAANEGGFRICCIYDCCNGQQKTHRNFKWKYFCDTNGKTQNSI